MTARRVCLVTSGNVSTDPRLVKAADALSAAGHAVRVVAVDARPDNAERDAAVMRGRSWTLDRVNLRRRSPAGFVRRATCAVLEGLSRRTWAAGLGADHAVARYTGPLTRAAASRPADVVLGHTLGALPATVLAAARLGALTGFDIEDLHAGERADDPLRAAIVDVERRYLRRCRTLTASSSGIADAVAEAYGVPRPLVVLNVFPLAERPAGRVVPRDRRGDAPSLYWYSQVIGPDRGLDDALDAVAALPVAVQLHLRGTIDPDFASRLRRRAARLGIGERLFIWPAAPPPELVARAAEHDVGLALEPGFSANNRLAASNKLFTYLLAGLAVAASNTPGQRTILTDAPGAGFLYQPGDSRGLAAGLRALLTEPGALAAARAASRGAAESRFNWDVEAPRLVAYLEGAWA